MSNKRALFLSVIIGLGPAVGRVWAQYENPQLAVSIEVLAVQAVLSFLVSALAFFLTHLFTKWLRGE